MPGIVYPLALNFIVYYLDERGRGSHEESNELALGFNIIIRVVANVLVHLVSLVLVNIIISIPDEIWFGCILGWYTNCFITVEYEFHVMPMIATFEGMVMDREARIMYAMYRQLNGAEFCINMNEWELDEYPNEKNCNYVIMNTDLFQGFYSL